MSIGNPLLTDDIDRRSYSLQTKSSAERHDSASSAGYRRATTFSLSNGLVLKKERMNSFPTSKTTSPSEETIRRFASTISGNYKNIGDSRRRSIRKSSILSSTNTDTSTAGKIEMEIIELENGTVKELTVFHIVLAGCAGVGKQSILRQFGSSEYRGIYSFTANSAKQEDPSLITVSLDDEEVRLQFFVVDLHLADTPLPSGDAYIVVYDITDRTSFEMAANVIKRLRDFPTILVANKSDLVRKRSVSYKDGLVFARHNRVKFVETSAALNDRIDQLLAGCIRQIYMDRRMESKRRKKGWCFPCVGPSRRKFNPEDLFV